MHKAKQFFFAGIISVFYDFHLGFLPDCLGLK